MAFIKRENNVSFTSEESTQSSNLDELLLAIQAPDPVIKRRAITDLVQYPQAAPVLIEQLFLDSSIPVRKTILLSLTKMATDVAIAGLINCLRSENVALRNDAIEAMSLMPNEVAPLMDSLLIDADPDVRIFSVNVLESLKHPNVEQWLIQVISHDDHINVCATAVDLLVEVGTSASIEPLKALKDKFNQNPFITFAVKLALQRIQGA